MPVADVTFPLVPRRRLVGLSFGAMHSARRGIGSDVAGSRPYQPGDDVDAIDWNASARLSSARGTDEFIVREHFADEAPRVVVLCDRRPAMGLFPEPLPWLSKPKAVEIAAQLISESAVAARSFIGYLDYADGEPFWRPPRSQRELLQLSERGTFAAPEDNLVRGLRFLVERREGLRSGSFLFVLSDFLVVPKGDAWVPALERRWDLVPVIIQDPVWEQSFPDVAGVVVPLVDPATGRLRPVRLTAGEVARRREANEQRLAQLMATFRALAVEPIVLSSSEPGDVLNAFLGWAQERVLWRGRGW